MKPEPYMQVELLEEAGEEAALMGMALSYKDNAAPFRQWWTAEQREKALKRAALLAPKGAVHRVRRTLPGSDHASRDTQIVA